MVDLDGRVFRAAGAAEGGEVDEQTEFRFRQSADLVWGRYSGGNIRLGLLVGTSDGTTVRLRYTQVTRAGETATGASTDRIEVVGDGRVPLHETWAGDSRDGTGTSVLEEVR